jgi:hypothetical protein
MTSPTLKNKTLRKLQKTHTISFPNVQNESGYWSPLPEVKVPGHKVKTHNAEFKNERSYTCNPTIRLQAWAGKNHTLVLTYICCC